MTPPQKKNKKPTLHYSDINSSTITPISKGSSSSPKNQTLLPLPQPTIPVEASETQSPSNTPTIQILDPTHLPSLETSEVVRPTTITSNSITAFFPIYESTLTTPSNRHHEAKETPTSIMKRINKNNNANTKEMTSDNNYTRHYLITKGSTPTLIEQMKKTKLRKRIINTPTTDDNQYSINSILFVFFFLLFRIKGWSFDRKKAHIETDTPLMEIQTSENDFEVIRLNKRYIYVDKTKYLFALACGLSDPFIWMLRPEGFGKTLMVSALRCYFEGRKELFEGLDIMKNIEKQKKRYKFFKSPLDGVENAFPVLIISFDGMRTGREEFEAAQQIRNNKERDDAIAIARGVFAKHFCEELRRNQSRLGVNMELFKDKNKPHNLLMKIAWAAEDLNVLKGGEKSVVVLIDGYDHPVYEAMGCKEIAEVVGSVLNSFYAEFKGRDENEELFHYVLMIGIRSVEIMNWCSPSNFSKVWIDERLASSFGYTNDELKDNFDYYLRRMILYRRGINTPLGIEIYSVTDKEINTFVKEMEYNLNGRGFSMKSSETVIDPMSAGKTLQTMQFNLDWMTSSQALVALKSVEDNVYCQHYLKRDIGKRIFNSDDLKKQATNLSVDGQFLLFHQLGFASIQPCRPGDMFGTTVANMDSLYPRCYLSFGNELMEKYFYDLIASEFFQRSGNNLESNYLKESLVDSTFDELYEDASFGAYNIGKRKKILEAEIRDVLSGLFRMGLVRNDKDFWVAPEQFTGNGRADMVVMNKEWKWGWVFELKRGDRKHGSCIGLGFVQIKLTKYTHTIPSDWERMEMISFGFPEDEPADFNLWMSARKTSPRTEFDEFFFGRNMPEDKQSEAKRFMYEVANNKDPTLLNDLICPFCKRNHVVNGK